MRAERPSTRSMRATTLGLALLALLPIIGRFLPGAGTWGVHMLAYLPLPFFSAAILAWVLFFLPAGHRHADQLVFDRFADTLFAPSSWPSWLAVLGLAGLFTVSTLALSTPTHLLGDGVLVADGIADGVPFYALDGMDYLLHRLAFQRLGASGDVERAFHLYAWGSRLAGALGLVLAIVLLRRSRLPAATRLHLILLWLLSGASLLYFGYVESYGFLSVAVLGFVWSGALAMRNEIPPFVPGICCGAALALHSSALLELPALAWLILQPPREGSSHTRWTLSLVLPAIGLPILAAATYLALGYDASAFRHDLFMGTTQSALVPLFGPNGLLSRAHNCDLLNWLVLVVPVPTFLLVSRARRLAGSQIEPDTAFALVQVIGFALGLVFLNNKLGGARDWDRMAPHIAGFVWLAARLWSSDVAVARAPRVLPSLRFTSCWAALLLVWPWFAVNASREASLRRFDEIRVAFAPYPRAYAAENLANYYRDAGLDSLALPRYMEAVRLCPQVPRFRALMVQSLWSMGRHTEAQAQMLPALEQDPHIFDRNAETALAHGDYAAAATYYAAISRMSPGSREAWVGLGAASFALRRLPQARDAFLRASTLSRAPHDYYQAGIASASLREWDAALTLFESAIAAAPRGRYYLALAVTLEGREASRQSEGRAIIRTNLQRASEAADRALQLRPQDPRVMRYRAHLDRVLSGLEAPTTNPR